MNEIVEKIITLVIANIFGVLSMFKALCIPKPIKQTILLSFHFTDEYPEAYRD